MLRSAGFEILDNLAREVYVCRRAGREPHVAGFYSARRGAK
jgi:hypothetical protein